MLMKIFVSFLIVLLFSLNASAYLNITIVLDALVSDDYTEEVQGAVITSGPYQLTTGSFGRASYHNVSEDILETVVTIIHPEFRFPEFPLKDYPYQLEGNKMVFNITGTALPKPEIQALILPLAASQKKARTLVKVRCHTFDAKDSLILLNVKNEFLTSFQKRHNVENHIAYEVPLQSIEGGGKVVNLTTKDTVVFGPNSWMHVISLQRFAPVLRADSEIPSILGLLKNREAIEQEHNNEIHSLKREVKHLEDSIQHLLHPHLGTPYPEPIPEVENHKEFWLEFPVETASRTPHAQNAFVPKLSEIVAAGTPQKTGKILIEMKIEKDGYAQFNILASAEEHANIARSLSHYLKAERWKPFTHGGIAYRSTQIFEFNIVPAIKK